MVKNTKGGSKTKNVARKHINSGNKLKINLLELLPTEDQYYAKVTKVLGGGKYRVVINTDDSELKKEKIAISRGKLNRSVKVNIGSIVLISIREFEQDKLDLLYIYSYEELNEITSNGYLTEQFAKQVDSISNSFNDDISGVEFNNNSSENNIEEELEWSTI